VTVIGGASAIDLANEFGTPLFVFSESRIRHNIERLKRAEAVIECPLKICYAAKANSNMAILRAVRDAGSDLEVNSGGELYKALKVGVKPEQIIFNGTSKTETELEEAISAGIYAIQADSLYEIELIAKVAQKLNRRANVSLRLVPEIETDTLHGLQTALLTSKFGMMPDEALQAFGRWQPDDKFLNLCGVHIHIGSQNPQSAPYTDALKILFENLLKIYQETGHQLSHLNLGGGFPVNYLRDGSHTNFLPAAEREMLAADFEPAEAIKQAWETVKKCAEKAGAAHLLVNITLLLEPGRSVISDAGICLTTVRNSKKRPVQAAEVSSQQLVVSSQEAETYSEKINFNASIRKPESEIQNDFWLLTDAGFNILLSMETYKWYYHLISANRAADAHDFPYKVAGPLCDGGDVYFDIEGRGRLPEYRLLPENVQPNEVLALLNCGAYSIAQMFQYNARQLPAVVLIKTDGAVKLARKRDEYDDLLINDVW